VEGVLCCCCRGGKGKEARGQHGIPGRKVCWANKRKGGVIKVIGQAVQKTGESGRVRGEGGTGVNLVRSIVNGGVTALKNGGVEGKVLGLHPGLVSDIVPVVADLTVCPG
jgi:hypothetical protein